jgi:RNA polymerase sigma-70 factor, ECF subfamily
VMHGEEATLIERLQRRDPAALGDLYDRYGRLTYSLIVRIVRDVGVAEDLTQETFLHVWIGVGRFDAERGSVRPWLLTVARNRAIDYLRAAERRRSCDSRSLESIEDSKLLADLERRVATSGETGNLRGALAKLSNNQRRVIGLAYFEGYSQTEMAAKLGRPVGTVKTWVRSALNLLREALRPGAVESSPAHMLSPRSKNDRSQVSLGET